MAKIFISYKREDKDVVFPIVDYISKQTQRDCWIDLDGVESGSLFEYKIIHAIDACDVVLFFMSKNSIAPFVNEESGKIMEEELTWTQREIAYALDHHKRIVSVSIDGTIPSDSPWFHIKLIGKDNIDYSDKDQRKKLLRDLKTWTTTIKIEREQDRKQIAQSYPKDVTPSAAQIDTLNAGKKQGESFFTIFTYHLILCAGPYFLSLLVFILSSKNYVQYETSTFRVIIANIASYFVILSLIWNVLFYWAIGDDELKVRRQNRRAWWLNFVIMIAVTALVFTKHILPNYTIIWGL